MQRHTTNKVTYTAVRSHTTFLVFVYYLEPHRMPTSIVGTPHGEQCIDDQYLWDLKVYSIVKTGNLSAICACIIWYLRLCCCCCTCGGCMLSKGHVSTGFTKLKKYFVGLSLSTTLYTVLAGFWCSSGLIKIPFPVLK